MKKITSFTGSYRFLSNFYSCEVQLEDRKYPTVEHAYQAAKTLNLIERNLIRTAKSPGLAKKLGRAATVRPDWETVKIEVMENLLRQKFAPDTELRDKLNKTAPAQLEEGNWWGDSFWGIYKGKGYNYLGKLLMKIRDEK